jgi:D-glucuronyl C5-epimerase C-terminus
LALAAVCALGAAAPAHAARVLVLEHDGRAVVRNDPFLPPVALTPPPAAAAARAVGRAAHADDQTVRTGLARLRRMNLISPSLYGSYLGSFNAALGTANRLRGTRGAELGAVISNLENMAAGGWLTPSRLPVLFLTLNRNRQWWTTGPLLGTYQRVQFTGSRLVWEYYPGQGIELQELGSFSTANALCQAGKSQQAACTQLLSELIPLAARRGGRLTWEYYFNFDGGVPPWTSAMSQGTALQALAHGYRATGDADYLAIGDRALNLFKAAPPMGVAVRTPVGARYVQYTFDSGRGDEVINAFLQSLIGLDEFAHASKSQLAARLFAAGNAEAQAELPSFDTGAWSLYQPGIEDDLSYHQLVTGFLQQLCGLTKARIYCATGARFQRDLKTPPALTLLTTHAVAHRPATVYFDLSKVSRVGITIRRGTTTVFLTSAGFPYGTQSFQIPSLAAGTYTVALDATDLAGNYNRITGTLHVAR